MDRREHRAGRLERVQEHLRSIRRPAPDRARARQEERDPLVTPARRELKSTRARRRT
jgi:hypothetical protein